MGGKGKGKGKDKGKAANDEADGPLAGTKRKACQGCGFAATWHPTHCCVACSNGNPKHGPRCGRQPYSVAGDDEATFDQKFPVVVEDGRRLIIQWNISDDLAQVAKDFACQHNIPLDELPTIVAFLEHATATFKQGATEQSNPVDQRDSQGSDRPRADLLEDDESDKLCRAQAQLEDMGLRLPPDTLRDLLKVHYGSVQRVIEALTAA